MVAIIVPKFMGTYQIAGLVTPGGGGGYTGPGNIVAFTNWYGTRAYTSASIGNNLIRLRESGANNEQNFASISGGGLDLAAIAAFKGANNLFVVTLYDQVGGINVTQATTSLQPAFILSGLGALPIIRADGTDDCLRATSSGISQPYSISAVAMRTGNFSGYNAVLSGTQFGLYFSNTSQKAILYSGGISADVAAANSVWHTFESVTNGSSSILMVDGTDTTGLAAGASAFGTAMSVGDNSAGGSQFRGDLTEAGVKSGAFTSQNRIDLDTNQGTYYGI